MSVACCSLSMRAAISASRRIGGRSFRTEALEGMSPELQQRLGLSRPERGYGAYLVSTAPQPKLGS